MADFTEKNREYFDKMASQYRERFGKATSQLATLVQDRRLWISDKWADTDAGKEQNLRMLEYACGPGAVSMALAPYLKNVVGVDLSENMVSEFNKNARDIGLADKMVGFKGDLFAEGVPKELTGPEFFNFDLVVVSMALHHFDDAQLAMSRLGERLKSGGVCFIIDLIPQEHHGHHGHHHHHGEEKDDSNDPFKQAESTIKKHGFSLEEMKDLFDHANLRNNFDYKVVEEPLEFNKDGKVLHKTIFVARAERA